MKPRLVSTTGNQRASDCICKLLMEVEYERAARFDDDESEDSYKARPHVWDNLRNGYPSFSPDDFAKFVYDNLRPMIYDCAFNPDDFAVAFIQAFFNAHETFETPTRAKGWDLPLSDPTRLAFLRDITVLVDLFSMFDQSNAFLTKVLGEAVELPTKHVPKLLRGRPVSTGTEAEAAYNLRVSGWSWGQIALQLRNTSDRKEVDQIRLATTRFAKRNKLRLPSPSD